MVSYNVPYVAQKIKSSVLAGIILKLQRPPLKRCNLLFISLYFIYYLVLNIKKKMEVLIFILDLH
jgi:hypothetical protein